jgi:uncharacterized caspase-like protein
MANQVCISIGIDRYQLLPPLSYGMADAVAMEQFFIDAAGWDADQCLLMTDTSPQFDRKSTYPDRENINRWIKQWSWEKLRHGDLLWFFFSGCGVSFGEEDYLLPIDGNPQDLVNTAISVRQLYQQFRDIGVNAMVFLDANRAQYLSVGGGIGKITTKLAQEYQIPTFLSCQSHEFSQEDAGLGHGLFTTALLETLNYHPDLNLETIETYLSTRLPELCEHHWKPVQTPLSILPAGVSAYRPVFSATTQSSISATVPEVIYTPPLPPLVDTRQEEYAPYTPPTISISIPERVGAGAIVKKTLPEQPQREMPHWAKISFLLTLMVAAGGGIYLFKSPSPSNNQPAVVRPVTENTSDNPTVTADIPSLAQAKLFIKPGDATSRYQAILATRKIPQDTPAIAQEVKAAIEVWSDEIYQIAQGYANKQYWQIAIDTARMVPQDAPNYNTVRAAMTEWKAKL